MRKSQTTKRKELKRNLKLVLKYAKKNKGKLYLYCIFNIVLTIIGAITPLISAKQLLKLTNGLLDQLLQFSLLILKL